MPWFMTALIPRIACSPRASIPIRRNASWPRWGCSSGPSLICRPSTASGGNGTTGKPLSASGVRRNGRSSARWRRLPCVTRPTRWTMSSSPCGRWRSDTAGPTCILECLIRVYEGLMRAGSKGAYYNRRIRGRYR
ncbi:MAG: KTSC domain-containing protein [Limisphaerales bacterium]